MSLSRGAVLALIFAGAACAQKQFYLGALGGVSTLSADGRSTVTAGSAASSGYKPENGGLVNLLGGVYLGEYLSLQGHFAVTRNDLTLTSVSTPDSAYEQKRSSSQAAGGAALLVYFRNRQSWIRPYLSAGAAGVRFKSDAVALTQKRGTAVLPPDHFSSFKPALEVAVGIDLRVGGGWALRYSFLEAIQGNPISAQLMPNGERNLATFQNMIGVVKSFGSR